MLRAKGIKGGRELSHICKGNEDIILTVRNHALKEILDGGILWEKAKEAGKKILKNEKLVCLAELVITWSIF